MVTPEMSRMPSPGEGQFTGATRRGAILKSAELRRQYASETQREIVDLETAKFETVMHQLMDATDNDHSIAAAQSELTSALDRLIASVENGSKLSQEQKDQLKQIFNEAAEQTYRLIEKKSQ